MGGYTYGTEGSYAPRTGASTILTQREKERRKHWKEHSADTPSAPAGKEDYLARIDIVKILNDKM